MADLQRTLSIIFEGVDNTKGTTQGIENQLDQLESSAKAAGTELDKLAGEAAGAGGKLDGLGGDAKSAGDKIDGMGNEASKAKGKLSDLSDTINRFSDVTSNIREVTQPFADLTAGAFKLEAGILAAGAAGTIFAAKIASDFDTAFRQISTLITDASDKDLAGFRDAVQDFAANSSKPLEDVMAAFNAAIGQGVKWQDSIEMITAAEKLSIATKGELKGTTEVLVASMSAYGLKAKDVGDVSDILAKTIADGKIEMDQLSSSFAMVTPIAAAAGIPLSELGAAIAVLTADGMKPAQAMEYLRGAISNIVAPSDQAQQMAKSLGLEFGEQALKTKGLAGVLADLNEKTGGSTEQMKILIGDIGGTTAALTLGADGAAKFKDAIASMGERAGTTQQAFEKMAGSLDNQIGLVVAAFNNLAIEIGTPLLDNFGSLSKAIIAIFEALADEVKDGSLTALVQYVEAQIDEITAAAEAVAKNLPAALENADLSGFTDSIDVVIAAVHRLVNIDITTQEGLTDFISSVGAGFLGLSKFVSGAVDSFGPLFDALTNVADESDGLGGKLLELAGGFSGVMTQIGLLVPALTGLLALTLAKQSWGIVTDALDLAAAAPLATKAVGSLASAIGPVALGAAAVFTASKVVDLKNAINELRIASTKEKESAIESESIKAKAVDTLQEFAFTTGIAVKSIDEADKLIEDGIVVWSDAAKGWVKAGDALAGVQDPAKSTGNSLREIENDFKMAALAFEVGGDAAKKTGDAFMIAEAAADGLVPVYDELTGQITHYTQKSKDAADSGKDTAKSLTDVAKEADKARKEAADMALELEKLASNERIKFIEAQVQLNVAQVEADAEKVKAIFASIDNTVNSTGDLLGELFKQMGNFDGMSWGAQSLIEDQIEIENQRRGEALELQKELTAAQIAEMRARTQSMQSGGGLIKIDGAGLQPHLEAFMWEILQAIQVRVNSDGMKMLLGV